MNLTENDIIGIKNELENGNGWVIINDINLNDPELSFIKLMNKFGTIVNQNNLGEPLSFIQDKGVNANDVLTKGVVNGDNKGQTTNRPYLTNAELEFHTDLSDLVFLLCVNPAKNGGENKVVNSQDVYNHMKINHKEELDALQDTFKIMHQTPLKPDGNNHLINIPIFRKKNGYFSSFLLRAFIVITYEKLGLELTEKRKRALDCVHNVSELLSTTLKLEKGQVLILNNHITYHSRNSFDDKERLLLRGWVSSPESRPLHDDFKELYGNLGAGEIRGGFVKL